MNRIEPERASAARGLVEYPFVFDDGTVGYLRLPCPFTAEDFRRLVAMLRTLPLDSGDIVWQPVADPS